MSVENNVLEYYDYCKLQIELFISDNNAKLLKICGHTLQWEQCFLKFLHYKILLTSMSKSIPTVYNLKLFSSFVFQSLLSTIRFFSTTSSVL